MWWQVVFWILLVPLVIAETIIYVKTKRLFWLLYSLAIFAYVIAVSYTLDVFDLNRNVIILVLLASSALMAYLGRHLHRAKPIKASLTTSIVLLGVLLAIFAISAIFGGLDITTTPAESIARDQITYFYTADGAVPPQGPVVLTRTLHNGFFLPTPVPAVNYQACLVGAEGSYTVYVETPSPSETEVPPGATIEQRIRVQPYGGPKDRNVEPTELQLYEQAGYDYINCLDRTSEPAYTIPIR